VVVVDHILIEKDLARAFVSLFLVFDIWVAVNMQLNYKFTIQSDIIMQKAQPLHGTIN